MIFESTDIDIGFNKLLWTGGWDSTFHLLVLLLERKEKVMPIYLLDPDRQSLAVEIKTMSSIRRTLVELHPECRTRLLPTVYHAVTDIPSDENISNAYKSITEHHHLGTQYEWLARYCKHEAIDDLQLCIEIGGAAESLIRHMIQSATNEKSYPHITSMDASDPIYTIFRYFSFPIINITKHEMQSVSKNNDWQQLMEMTWFCLTPTRHDKPCGICNPCRLVIKEGLGWRISSTSRIYGTLYRQTIDPLRSLAKKILIKAHIMK